MTIIFFLEVIIIVIVIAKKNGQLHISDFVFSGKRDRDRPFRFTSFRTVSLRSRSFRIVSTVHHRDRDRPLP
jgi:hypothetical protein